MRVSFQSNVMKLFDFDETIVTLSSLSGSAAATGGVSSQCQRFETMCLRGLYACNVRICARERTAGGTRKHSPISQLLFLPSNGVTRESTLRSKLYPPRYPTSRIYSFSLGYTPSLVRPRDSSRVAGRRKHSRVHG